MAALLLAAALSGCAIFKDPEEESKNWTAQQFYDEAKEQLDSGSWEAAIKLYEQLEAKYPFGRLAQQAALDTAYAHYKNGNAEQSIATLDRFMKQHPQHPNLDYALYLKGLVNFKEDLGLLTRLAFQDLADRDPKSARESFEVFKELVTRFPASRYAPDSRERMAYLVEALARHELKVAAYYLKRGAHLAAANRAQDAITRFPNSPAHREALEIMVEAYDRMGFTELRDDAKRVLAKNFPGDPLAREGSNRTRPWWRFWN